MPGAGAPCPYWRGRQARPPQAAGLWWLGLQASRQHRPVPATGGGRTCLVLRPPEPSWLGRHARGTGRRPVLRAAGRRTALGPVVAPAARPPGPEARAAGAVRPLPVPERCRLCRASGNGVASRPGHPRPQACGGSGCGPAASTGPYRPPGVAVRAWCCGRQSRAGSAGMPVAQAAGLYYGQPAAAQR